MPTSSRYPVRGYFRYLCWFNFGEYFTSGCIVASRKQWCVSGMHDGYPF